MSIHEARVPREVEAVLLDVDGNLVPSEEPAFAASAGVVNRFLERLGDPRRFDAEQLRRSATGRNFRATARELSRSAPRPIDAAELEDWVLEEQRIVAEHLGSVLQPDPEVGSILEGLAARHRLAAVSSSGLPRVRTCLEAAGLAHLFDETSLFSAEDSIFPPASKPDPAVYLEALRSLQVEPDATVAIEDAAPGVLSAMGAGIRVVGNLHFVPAAERPGRAQELREAGAETVVESWHHVARAAGAQAASMMAAWGQVPGGESG